MPIFPTKPRFWFFAVCAISVAVAGCGGAQARKARHLEKGQAYLVAGNLEKARVEFRNALQIAPADSEARYQNGVVDEKLGNPREAAQFYQGAIEVNSDNVPARVSLGRVFLFAGSPERALETIKPAFAQHPDDAGLLMVRAAARIQMKDQNGALADAERAVQLAPTSEDAVAVLAGVYKSAGQPEKTESLLRESIKKIPTSVELRLALAQLYGSTGHDPEVEPILVELARLNPLVPAHCLRLAQYYAHMNRIDDAERVLRDGIKALPKERGLKIALIDFLATRRDRAAAEKQLDAFIADDPKDYALRASLGQFYEQGKQSDKAEKVYQGIISDAGTNPPGITARNRLAALYVEQGNAPAAEKLIAEVLAENPRDNDALILRGNLALAQKDPKTAIADLRAVLRDQPNAVGVMRSLARAHLANGEPALAEDTMRHAVDANPQDSGARLDFARLLIQLGKAAQAAPVVNELVKQQPDNLQALDAQFKIAAAGNDLILAKSAADAIVTLQPKAALGYYYQGTVAEADKRPADALDFYSTALGLQADSTDTLAASTRILVGMKRQSEALRRLDDVISQFPKEATAANLKGEVLLSQKDSSGAAQAFKVAIDRDPQWDTPYRNLAIADLTGHDSTGAIAALQSGIAKAATRGPLESELATLYERSGKPEEAIGVYEAALVRDPKSELVANNLAMMLVTYRKDQHSLERAKQLSAHFSTSSNPDLLDTYGWVLYKRGEGATAVAALQSALTKAPDSPVTLYHLGMAQVLTGHPEAARDSLARSLNTGKNFSGMEEAKAELDNLAKITPAAPVAPKS